MTRDQQRRLRKTSNFFIFCALLFSLSSLASAGEEWPPVSPEELKMASEPNAPGAPAIYLYRQVDRDDSAGHETTYERIKILTEDGRKYADVEIPFLKGRDNIKGIRARTVQPDGSIINLDGKVYEETIVKARGVKFLSKTFTMPQVGVGSIVEYRYTNDMNQDYVYDSYWALSSDLFTKLARFSLRPSPSFTIFWSWPNRLPEGTQPPRQDHGVVRLEARNIPAFQAEDYMPPERELKFRVDFVYQSAFAEKDQTKYWKSYGQSRYRYNEEFLDKPKALQEAVATIIQPTDDPVTKLQKIYARVQQLRNLSYEREKTEQEEERDKRRDVNSVIDIWKQGTGTASQINYLFVGLVRAAGMDAFFVDVSTRDSYFFKPETMNSRQLDHNVVLVKLADKDLFFDPGARHVPFGLLPWYETNLKGLQCSKDGGPWINTPLPDSSVSGILHKADLHLTEEGSLEGKVTVTYSGLEAVEIRNDGDDQDDPARRKILEDDVRQILPVGAEVNLVNKPDWDGSSPAMVGEFTIRVQGWATNAGRRELLPMGLFSGGEKHVFEHANRTYALYFQHAYTKTDDVTIALPEGWKIGNLPPPIDENQKLIGYASKAEDVRGIIHISRSLRLDLFGVPVSYYTALRNFFQFVRSNDERQIILQPAS
jgi:hypothetical protein